MEAESLSAGSPAVAAREAAECGTDTGFTGGNDFAVCDTSVFESGISARDDEFRTGDFGGAPGSPEVFCRCTLFDSITAFNIFVKQRFLFIFIYMIE